MLTNDIDAIVTSSACEIDSYIILSEPHKISNTLIKSPCSLRLDKLNRFSSIIRFS